MNRIPSKEIHWWGWRWGTNAEMLAHMEDIGKDAYLNQNDVLENVSLRRSQLIVGATKKILTDFGKLLYDPATSLPEPDWLQYDGSEDSLRIPTEKQDHLDGDGYFVPPFEMEHLAPLACFMWLHLDGNKHPLNEDVSGSYAITGNLAPTPEELWKMLLETLNAEPQKRKWFDYHIRAK